MIGPAQWFESAAVALSNKGYWGDAKWRQWQIWSGRAIDRNHGAANSEWQSGALKDRLTNRCRAGSNVAQAIVFCL
jgi:hypothetical protein